MDMVLCVIQEVAWAIGNEEYRGIVSFRFWNLEMYAVCCDVAIFYSGFSWGDYE